jgi:hypothetical protein
MSTFKRSVWLRGAWLWLSLAVVAGTAAVAYAQFGGAGVPRERPRMEYLQQEVQADAIVQTLNDLDGQGWDLFQIVPAWSFKNDNGEATLIAKTYQVFGRRPLKTGK